MLPVIYFLNILEKNFNYCTYLFVCDSSNKCHTLKQMIQHHSYGICREKQKTTTTTTALDLKNIYYQIHVSINQSINDLWITFHAYCVNELMLKSSMLITIQKRLAKHQNIQHNIDMDFFKNSKHLVERKNKSRIYIGKEVIECGNNILYQVPSHNLPFHLWS